MAEGDGLGSSGPVRGSSGVSHRVALFLSWILQRVVFFLETVIEWLSSGSSGSRSDSPEAKERRRRREAEKQLARARKLADYGDSEKALKLLIAMLEHQPECTAALDLAAEVLLETGDYLGAKELVLRSIQINPTENSTKFVLLGQLEHGNEAIEAFTKGYEVLKSEHDALERGSTEQGKLAKERQRRRQDLQRKMSSVLTSIAKVYLVDCFHEDRAEKLCEETLDSALLRDPNNPEAVQALADLRLSQHRKGEALSLVQRTLDLCDASKAQPSYDFRAVTARLLVELSKYDVAIGLLKDLVAEDDEDTEVWYLLGLCYVLTGDGSRSKGALANAKRIIETVSGADASLIERIDKLAKHRVISETEKDEYWNPRWWAKSVKDAKGVAEGAKGEGADEALTLIPLSEKDPSQCQEAPARLEV